MARTRRTAISFRETLTLIFVCCLLLPSVTDRLNIQVPACSISLICRFFVIVPSALQKAHSSHVCKHPGAAEPCALHQQRAGQVRNLRAAFVGVMIQFNLALWTRVKQLS